MDAGRKKQSKAAQDCRTPKSTLRFQSLTTRILPLSLCFLALLNLAPAQEAEWQAVLALDAGPQEALTDRETARAASLRHLEKQEAALRDFTRQFPRDARALDATLRLAHLYATRSDLAENPAHYTAAQRLLDDALKTAPQTRKADVAFAKISLSMRRISLVATEADRKRVTEEVFRFCTQYPGERRIAPLLAEIATLYDNQPDYKKRLLEQALKAAPDDGTRSRINDDLRRLAWLGKSVPVRGGTLDGGSVDVADFRGKLVVVYFFASWSPGSMARMGEVERLRKSLDASQLQIIGVCLDEKKEDVPKVPWPVIWDGRGWKGELVRTLGINALPTFWMLDKTGTLRTLNVRSDAVAVARALQ